MFPRSSLTRFFLCVNATFLKASVSCRDNMATSPNEMYEMPFRLRGMEYMSMTQASLQNCFKEHFQLQKEKECLDRKKKMNSTVAARR